MILYEYLDEGLYSSEYIDKNILNPSGANIENIPVWILSSPDPQPLNASGYWNDNALWEDTNRWWD